jgi:hypothetical protein
MFFGLLNQEEWDWRDMWQEWGIMEVHTDSWWGNLKERVHLKYLGVNRRGKLR